MNTTHQAHQAGTMPACDGPDTDVRGCRRPITHIDPQGFVYCFHHGSQRRASGGSCRRLKPTERQQLAAGGRVRRY